MSEYTSYYLYQKYEVMGRNAYALDVYSIDADGTMAPVVKKDNDFACGYTEERWIPLSGTVCEYVQERWVKTDDTICEEVMPVYEWERTDETICQEIVEQYKWQVSGTTCIGFDKYNQAIKQISYDSGVTWQNAIPYEYSATTLVERNSEDCGYSPTSYSGQYLTFVALEDATFRFLGTQYSDGTTSQYNEPYYSLDSGITWTKIEYTASTPTVSSGNTIMWKGTMTPITDGLQYGLTNVGVGRFQSSDKFSVIGNPMSLLYGDNFTGETSLSGKDCAFMYLFYAPYGNAVENASGLSLHMTTLSPYCYANMFYGCTNLTSAPQLPATTLQEGCYLGMFESCASLQTAPQLPAPILTTKCYGSMFRDCTSLNNITCFATNISATDCVANFTYNVSKSGTFCKKTNTSWSTGRCGIPYGWTIINYNS